MKIGIPWEICGIEKRTYSGVQISWQRVFWAGNQGNHQNFHNGRLKKRSFSSSANSQYFFQKFHGLVLGLVELIDAKGIDVAQPICS